MTSFKAFDVNHNELQVTQLQCKIKINQHRPESHAAMRSMYAAGSENEQNLALWMDRLGLTTGSNNHQEN